MGAAASRTSAKPADSDELEREGALELGLLVGGLLRDERLVDPTRLSDRIVIAVDRHDAVEADRLRAEQPRDDQALREHDRVHEREHARVHRGPADDVRAQAPRALAPAAHRAGLRPRRRSASAATAASTTIDGSAAKRKRVPP